MADDSLRAAVFACLLSGVALPGMVQAGDEAAPAGILWETTSQISMGGMPFSPPPNRMKVCATAGEMEPPGSAGEDRGCVNSDFVREGMKVTWTSVCSGPPEMTGQGEITYDAEFASYSGAIRYATADGPVTIKLSGQQAGPCDNPR